MIDLASNHGSAERIPPPDEPLGSIRSWMGSRAALERTPAGDVAVTIPNGPTLIARPGDWLIRTMAGAVHLARAEAET